MSEIVDETLKKVAKGTTIVFAGTIVSMLLEFISRVIIARNTMQSEYGLFSLGFALFNIFAMISCLGLLGGTSRYIGYFRGKNDVKKARSVISSSLQLAITASVVCSLLVFFTSDFISQHIFHSQELATVIKIFSIGIPFFVIIEILSSIYVGFDRAEPKAYFSVLRDALKVSLVAAAIFLCSSFLGMIYAYVLSIVIAGVVFLLYTTKKYPIAKKGEKNINLMRKELLYFSIPLLTAGILGMIMGWMDTLMLGYFKTPDVVGLYNAARPISGITTILLYPLIFISTPVLSQLYSRNLIDEMKRNYAVLTKWIFSATLPILLIIFLFPETVLNITFGFRYIQASTALQILALGMSLLVFLGPNEVMLIVMGKTKLLMRNNLVAVIANLALNILLIPWMGILGAATATAISLAIARTLNSIQIYISHGIHPFTGNYLKPILTSMIFIYIIYAIAGRLFDVTSFWALLILLILFSIAYGSSLLFTKSLDREDIMMLLTIEERLGIDLTSIKKILRRFV